MYFLELQTARKEMDTVCMMLERITLSCFLKENSFVLFSFSSLKSTIHLVIAARVPLICCFLQDYEAWDHCTGRVAGSGFVFELLAQTLQIFPYFMY